MDESDKESIEGVYLEDCDSYVLKIKQEGKEFGSIDLHFKTKELLRLFIRKVKAEVKKL